MPHVLDGVVPVSHADQVHRLTLLPVVALTAAVLSGCSASPSAPATPTPTARAVNGSITLTSGAYYEGDPCEARDGYDDIAEGAEADIVDGSNRVIGIGKLGAGASGSNGCQFYFTVEDVPLDQRIYGVRVGNQNRGIVHFSRAQLFAGDADLTLG